MIYAIMYVQEKRPQYSIKRSKTYLPILTNMYSTYLPDDVSHLYNFGNLVGNEFWHVQTDVAFLHVLSYSYPSFIIYCNVSIMLQ
jgi:hypothetical protein